MSSGKKYFYVKVIEAKGIVKGANESCEPFVTVKLNGHEYLHKKSTHFHTGVEWWEQMFKFKIKNTEADFVAIELREKGYHIVGSDWLGEIQLRVRDFKDGEVHENWYKLGRGTWKVHTREPRGFIHVALQVKGSKFDRPFTDDPIVKRLTFEEWQATGMAMPGLIGTGTTPHPVDSSHKGEDPQHFSQTFETMEEAETKISKDAWKILMTENPTYKELEEMKKLNRVNCLHKGKFDLCKGKRYMVCIDGTNSSKEAFRNCLKLVDPENDHMFIVTIRERALIDEYDDNNRTLLSHKLWRAAAGIIQSYQDEIDRRYDGKLDYTSIMPEAHDAREMVCLLAKKYKADIVVIGKHKDNEVRHSSKYFRSFQRYCQGHAKCTVMTF